MKGLYFRGRDSAVPVEASAGAHELRLVVGGVTRSLPFHTLQLSLGGTHKRYLVCRATLGGEEQLVYLERTGLVAELEADGASPEFIAQVRALVGAHRRDWALSRTLILSVAALLALGLGWSLLQLRGWALASVPPAWEVSLGQAAFEQYAADLERVEDPELEGFARGLVERILAAHPEHPYVFEVHVVRDPAVNAFAFPGGQMVVHTGLIAEAAGPEEVAGVLGHEVSHVLLRHGLESIVDRVGVVVLLGLLFDSGEALAQLEAASGLLDLKFSRDHEREADALGARLLHEADIDPRALGAFFARLGENEGELERSLQLLSTHPHSAERGQALEAVCAGLPAGDYRGLDVDWAELQRRARGE